MPSVVSGRALVAGALLLAGCAARPAFPPEPAAGTLFRSFTAPAGPGPFPAVVLLHTCAGVRPHLERWTAWLGEHGYATVVLDSFSPRHAGSVCGSFTVSVGEVADDAVTALEALRHRPGIDPDRIGVVGFSYGAFATLRVASPRYHGQGRRFAAAVAVYPLCVPPRTPWPVAAVERASNLYDDVDTPTLILIGDADHDTPDVAANCADAVTRLRATGRPVDIKLYPGARHAFDQPQAYDAAATEDAMARALAFFDRHLGRAAAAR